MGEPSMAGAGPRSERILKVCVTFLPGGKCVSLAVGVLGEESGSVVGDDSSSPSGEKGCFNGA